jgi:fatty acid desaturase
MLQTILYGFGDGMSSGWWNNQHNRHHAMPQRLKHDVDLDTLPLMAFTSKIFPPKLKKSFWIQNQAKLFLMIDTFLVALLWKIYLHPRYCIKTRKWTQLGFMALHYIVLMSLVSQPIYWASVWFGSIYIFGNFALSHTHLPVTEADETNHWIEFAFHATTNVSSNFVIDWWMGYLNYQVRTFY